MSARSTSLMVLMHCGLTRRDIQYTTAIQLSIPTTDSRQSSTIRGLQRSQRHLTERIPVTRSTLTSCSHSTRAVGTTTCLNSRTTCIRLCSRQGTTSMPYVVSVLDCSLRSRSTLTTRYSLLTGFR